MESGHYTNSRMNLNSSSSNPEQNYEDFNEHESIVEAALRVSDEINLSEIEHILEDNLVPRMCVDGVNRFSMEIVRSRRFDSTAKLDNPSLTCTEHHSSSSKYRNINHNEYFTPFDRIARYYTPSALGLTIKEVDKIAKILKSNPIEKKPTNSNGHGQFHGINLTATAPDAFEAHRRISSIANSDAPITHTKRVREKLPKPLPYLGSPEAIRNKHRMTRSNPSFTTIEVTPASGSTSASSTNFTGEHSNAPSSAFPENSRPTPSPQFYEEIPDLDFNQWNPEDINEFYDDSKNGNNTSLISQYSKKIESFRNFYIAVQDINSNGVITSTGSGHRAPVPQIQLKILDNIIQKISSFSTSSSGSTFRKYVYDLNRPEIKTLLTNLIHEIQANYSTSIARSCVEYLLKNSQESKELNINNKLLYNNDLFSMWYNKYYTLYEFRILRYTYLPSIYTPLNILENNLCTTYSIMLELQNLWFNGKASSFNTNSIGILLKQTYNKILFINSSSFSLNTSTSYTTSSTTSSSNFGHTGSTLNKLLPYTLNDFYVNINTYSKDIHETLLDTWLLAAGGKLSQYISTFFDNIPENLSQSFEFAENASHEESLSLFEQFKEKNKSIKSLYNKSPTNNNNIVKKKAYKISKILDSVSVLISRQLRFMCENSLEEFAQIFERYAPDDNDPELLNPSSVPSSIPLTACPSIFIVNLRLQKKDESVTLTDFSSSVNVILQPNFNEFKKILDECIVTIVRNARDFPRIEQLIGSTFGGKNYSLISELLIGTRHKTMNECTVSETDDIVRSIKSRITKQLEKYYIKPENLLLKFNELNELLSGNLYIRVENLIKSIHSNSFSSINDLLDALEVICTEIKTLKSKIATIVPDVCYFLIIEVHCSELKEALTKQCNYLYGLLMDTIVEDNRSFMSKISQKYSEVSNILISSVTDCAELRSLQEYTNKSAHILSELQEQYVVNVYERVKFLLNHSHKFSREDLQALHTTFYWPVNIQSYLKQSFEMQASCKKQLEQLLEDDQNNFELKIQELFKKIDAINDKTLSLSNDYITANNSYDKILMYKKELENYYTIAESIVERETLLEIPHIDFQMKLEEIKANLEPLEVLWATERSFVKKREEWDSNDLKSIDPEEAEKLTEEFIRVFTKISREFDKFGEKRINSKNRAIINMNSSKNYLQLNIPLMLLICNPGMEERHWKDIEAVTGIKIDTPPVNMKAALAYKLNAHTKQIEDICIAASKEYSLQTALYKMQNDWKSVIFETKEYRTSGTRILTSVDEIQQLLDDHIVKTQSMKSSRYIKPFLEKVTEWEETLVNLQDILDNWLKVQATWLYLEPIFSSDDIMRQLPTEGKMFKTVDNIWRISMAQTNSDPSCISVANRPGFLDSLIDANAKLEQIQKGLNDYLETKRLAFPRFFFLSNDELLEILAETKDPLRVQPHLKKCFDGIAKLHFLNNLDIVACYDPKNEKLDFPYEKINHRKINPNDSGGNVEKWLIEVEAVMKKSLAYTIDLSVADYLANDRLDWLKKWQGQVIICINQIRWCFDVERTIKESQESNESKLPQFYDHLCKELIRTVELVRGDIPKSLRVSIGALVVMDVHNRDTVQELINMDVTNVTDFDWQSQLRYYWKNDGESAQTGKPGTVECKMINALALYAYEYIGNQDRLVITPLTDRCYRTLMGAIHLNLGGAPEGPAGTGKTETTKDLAKAIAIQCVVTNCSDGLDYLAMAKFFKGLASSGAWACFDEFNRIQLEVLSVIAQQILQIQMAKIRGLKKFVFEGTELELRPTCCPFITMNPGYAGRAELPDNLKVLFRTVAMMVPDYAMISEIILYSYGYTTARPLAVKIVTTYKLCSEQLSSQSHYDYGMRAVIAVLRAAGNLKRSDGHLPEDVLVLRSIIDVNLPKFLSPDVPLFNGIVSDLFPGVSIDPPDRNAMKQAFEDVCEMKGLIPEEYFWEKVVQIYDMMVVRHGFMVVGLPFSGKTSAWRVLAEVLGLLSERFPQDKRYSKVYPIIQNPKSISMGQLYGCFDAVSHEWTDGVLAINYRNAASNKIGNPEDRKWILFDGPVDAIWIENMNTVLDDNKKLCLMSGEIIAMTDVMSMIFEPMDLLAASPATVSRCGMIYMEPEILGWAPLLKSWIEFNSKEGLFFKNRDPSLVKFILYSSDVVHIQGLFDWLVEPSLCFIRKECQELSPTVDSNLVSSLIGILESLLIRTFAKYKNPDSGSDEEVTDLKKLKQRIQDIECCFFFSLIWSIGKTGNEESQKKYSNFLENYLSSIDCIESNYGGVYNLLQMKKWKKPDFLTMTVKGNFSLPMPMKVDYYECVYLPEESKWKTWSDILPAFSIPPNTPYSNIVVPNSYTAQYNFLIELLIPNNRNLLFCGPTGTGKSVYIANSLSTGLPQDKYKPLSLGFSAKTSANMTQDIIDGKLDKRRKGVYGPPQGQHCIIFIDDLNMPEVETYGAQPPIELIRQLIDNGGWYDLKDKTWKTIIDTSLIAAMGPPGGGRNHITPRLLRHFNLFCFNEFDDTTLKRIFSTIVQWHFSNFTNDIRSLADSIVEATLDTYRASMSSLLPTPQKSHYTFNLRDFSRVIQGVLLCKPSEEFNKKNLIRLWTHEALRVFADRLIDDVDREWFHKHIELICVNKFNSPFYDIFKHLDVDNKKKITVSDMRSLIFGDYFLGDSEKNYVEIKEMSELNAKMEEYLSEYNQQSRKPMDLVMFNFAIEHISRISRILKMPGGNALLVGVGGSGRQSVTRLASFMAGFTVFQIEISKNYSNAEWREDLKTILKGAGTGSQPLTFLFSDTQIKSESFVEDINNMLNNGEVPNIFPSDERSAVCEAVRPFARQIYGKAAGDMTLQELYAFFIKRVKQNLHIVLAFSPIGDAFRDRLRKFPALINCCTIDWFTAWPTDALIAVAERFLSNVKFDSDDMRSSIVTICQEFHQNVINLSEEFLNKLKRRNYVTPTSYLELILAYKQNLDLKRSEVIQSRMRYETGLDKLAFAAGQVNKMQKELEDLQPELMKSAADTEQLMSQIQQKMPGVLETRRIVTAEAEVAQKEADIVQGQKDEVEADLAKATPILEEAVRALDTIKSNDINEIKALAKPPEKIRMVCKAVCIMFDIKPVRIPDPNDPSKRIMDYWGPSQKMLSDSGFLNSLIEYDKDNISERIMKEIKKEFISNPEFDPEIISKASKAAEGMCKWVRAMETYDTVAKVVAPKKAALMDAQDKLNATLAALNMKKAELQKVEDDLKQLEDQLSAAKQKKLDLENQADLCGKKIERANQLLDGLGGERERWGQFAADLSVKFSKLTGDVLISSGVLAYLGPFTALYRNKQIKEWIELLKVKDIPCSDSPTLANTLGDPVKIRQWNIDGLPTDNFSIDNGIVVFNARRWPLMIDPQGQANKWIRNMEKSNNLQVIKLTDGNYLRALENAIQFGNPVLLENIGEELDPSLEPLLLKQLFKQGGVNCIRLGDSTVEYSDSFRFYITTKLRNPHYVPEISVKVTLLNFMITPEGLQDQLLGIVVSQERPDLEEQRNALIIESAANKRQLQDIEDRILHIMSSSSGNILEDETAIQTLNNSKILSDEIKEKQSIAEDTEKNIDNVRLSYSPIAYSSQILFFCIADLANIEPVYQYSLSWFINLFINSINKSEKGRDVAKRLENLNNYFTYSLYCNVSRSLLEKDKLLFSFLLTSRILAGKKNLDPKLWFYLLTGGGAVSSKIPPNPAPEWVSTKTWEEICKLSEIPSFENFYKDFNENILEWKRIYDSINPQDEIFPGRFKDEVGLTRLCALRFIRSDKLVIAIQQFISDQIGEKFIKPPPFDLNACYNDSSCVVPLVFILSPGSDPMGAVLRAAELLKTTVEPISLGQGQGPKAEKLIERAKEKGTWVVLQNCHLAPSWMTTLEKICEELDIEETHPGFRLWCTTYPSDVFPVAVLQNGVKMTNEPPKGVRANLLGSFNSDPIASDDFFLSVTSKPKEFKRLIYSLCFFHAVVQERRLYGPLGWNIPYEFNESDLRISLQQLKLFIEENDAIPFKALIYTAGECNYGGRVTDDKDRRTLMSILNRFYNDKIIQEDEKKENEDVEIPSNPFTFPPLDTISRQDFITFIDHLPLTAPPEVFGLHENATLTKDQNDTNLLLNSIIDTESGSGDSAGDSNEDDPSSGPTLSKDESISAIAADILSKLPENFDMEYAQLKYPVLWNESMNTVLCQELLRFNNLLTLMRNSLKEIQKAVKGLVVMSSELEVLGNSLYINRLPLLWKSRSYPSLKPLAGYIQDQQERLAFFRDWLNNDAPSVFWLSAFFFTQAFLTGSAQNFARKYTIPIDDVVFDFDLKEVEPPKKRSQGEMSYLTLPPENGVYTTGFFIEGARWDGSTRQLEESLPKVLFTLAPIIHWQPYRKAQVPTYPHYKCPVYKTSDRRGVLATTGHSSNFVCFIHLPTDLPESHWVERGVAMLTQLDN